MAHTHNAHGPGLPTDACSIPLLLGNLAITRGRRPAGSVHGSGESVRVGGLDGGGRTKVACLPACPHAAAGCASKCSNGPKRPVDIDRY